MKKNEFKKGDKVRYTNGKPESQAKDILTLNEEYTVDSVDALCIFLEGLKNKAFVKENFTLVERNKFKDGDKVKYINTKRLTVAERCGEVPVFGNIYTINGYSGYNPVLLELEGKTKYNYWDERGFELVQEKTELESLIEKANEGQLAVISLYKKYKDKFNVKDSPNGDYCIYSIKKEKVFKPFHIGLWDVNLINHTLHIGCREYDSLVLKSILEYFLNEDGTYLTHHSTGSNFYTKRSGITEEYKGTLNTIKWEEAKILLKVLNEYYAD